MTTIGVALVIDALDRGGAERILVSLANNLDKEKYQVHVITTHHYGSFISDLNSDILVHCLNRHHRLSLTSLFRFYQIVKNNKILIIHSHCHSSAYFVEISRLLLRINFFHVMHDHFGPIFDTPWIRCLDRLLLRNLDFYFGVSKSLVHYAESQLGLPVNKCQYVPNGIDIPSSINFGKNENFTVIQVGSITPSKNHLLALRIAKQVSNKVPNLRWLIIGRLGKDADHIKSIQNEIHHLHLEEIIYLLGEKSNVQDFLGQANVGVLTSRDEALPMALLEYMAYGLPVVVTDVGDCRQVVEKCEGGKVYSITEEDLFSQELIKLAENPTIVMEWGRKNYENVKQYYSVNSMAKAINEEYGKLLESADAR